VSQWVLAAPTISSGAVGVFVHVLGFIGIVVLGVDGAGLRIIFAGRRARVVAGAPARTLAGIVMAE
jgi:hypothetical protein